MDPVCEEYFCTVELVKGELASFKQEQGDLKQKISSLYQKNKTLIREFRESTLKRDYEVSEKGIRNLEHSLSLANAAKESALLLWQEAMQRLENLEDQLTGRKSLYESEREGVVSSIEQIREQYQKGVATLSAELSSYRSNLSEVKQEMQSKCLELEQRNFEMKNLKDELVSTQTRLSTLASDNSELERAVNSLKQELSDKNSLLLDTKNNLNEVNSMNSELQSACARLKEQNAKLKQEIKVFEKDAKESLFTAQDAILRRKEMAYKEEQYLKEIEILRSSSGVDVQKSKLRCNMKIKEIQERHTEQIKSLMAEIEELHKENGAKQYLFEKVEREKKALESKLEILSAEASKSFPASNKMLDDLCNQLNLAEKARDEHELRVKSLNSDLEEMRCNAEHQAKRFSEEKNILKERLSNMSKEFRLFLSDKIKLSEEVCLLKRRCQELERELVVKQARQTQEISAIKGMVDRKQQSFGETLRSIEEHYKTVCGELQTLLESQFSINKKWKEETDELISQSESKINELCDTIAQLQCQNAELVLTMQKSSSYRQAINTFMQ